MGCCVFQDGGRTWQEVGGSNLQPPENPGHLTPTRTVGQDLALDGWLTIPGLDAQGVYRRSIAAAIKEAAVWGHTKVVPLAPGPWRSAGEYVTRPNWLAKHANESTTTTHVEDDHAANSNDSHIDTWQPAVGGPLPGSPLVFLSIASGGVAGPLSDGTFVVTPSIRYSAKSDYAQQINDCNPYGEHNSSDSYCESVVAFVSDTTGRNWTMRSTVASPRDMLKGNKRLPHCPPLGCEEGPSENAIALLRDGKTLLNVMRIDGGDGQPHSYHVPYLLARSTDMAYTWTISQAPPALLSARPYLLTLPNGALVLSGGRPGLSLWVSADGFGKDWQTYDIPTEHNKLVSTAAQGCDGAQGCRFCDGFCNVTCKPPCGAGEGIYAGGWFQSSGELSLLPLSSWPCTHTAMHNDNPIYLHAC